MVIEKFPPIEEADGYGVLAVGGDLEIESLLLAYRSGIFPWPFSEEFPVWFAPPKRALLFLNEFHLSKSLRKEYKKGSFEFAIDRDFEAVIRHCSTSKHRHGQSGTWITSSLIDAYIAFHRAGYAHSIECYREGRLIGGLYGVSIGGMFAGESMFYLEPNGSKLALCYLVEYLRQKGVAWIDCQVLTKFLASMGAREISREEFMQLLVQNLAQPKDLF